MTIQSGSRYVDSMVVNLAMNNKARQVIVPGTQEPYIFQYQSYMIDASDRPDSLAQAFYGNPTLWWAIADANPEIMDWSSVASGSIIRIPNI